MAEKIKYLLITALMRLLGVVSSALGRESRTACGSLSGDIMRLISRKRRNITLDNIRSAFPEEPDCRHKAIMTESYRNLGITLWELLAMKDMPEPMVRDYISYTNPWLMEEVTGRGKGALLLSGHYGNWELLAYSAGLFFGLDLLVVVKPLKNYYSDRILNRNRTRGGNTVIAMNNAAKHIVRQLLSKKVVALLADQSATEDKDIFVEFFGRPASTYEAPASLALRLGVPVIMGFANRQADGRYTVELTEIRHDDLSNDKDGITEFTKRHVKALEEAVRNNPGHWSWQHRRWKHQPQKEKNNETITRDN